VRKTQLRLLVSLAVVVVAATAGLYTSAGLAPERLRWEIERLLQRATGSPVSMDSLRLVVGFPIHLDARRLRLWGGGLTIDRAIARIDAFSLLTGRPRLSRLTLNGAHLRIRRAWRGDGPAWSPRPFARLAERAGDERPEPLLAPLHGIEATVRFLLSRPLIADTLQVRDSRISYVHDFSDAGGGVETLWFAGIHGVLRHSRLRGDASLFTAARLLAIDGPRGSVEWAGTRSRDGTMRISMAATELELGTLVPYLSEGRRDSQLSGRLSGVADYATATPGEGRLSLDLVVRDFASAVDSDAEGNIRSVAVDAFSSRMEVALDAGFLELSNARIWGPELGFGLEAVVERPLRPESNAGLAVSLEDLDLAQISALLGWLPSPLRERAQKIAGSILSGRISAVEIRGGASLQHWRDTLARRADRLPRGLQVLADVEDVGIAIGAVDRLEGMNARVTWRDDRLIVEGGLGAAAPGGAHGRGAADRSDAPLDGSLREQSRKGKTRVAGLDRIRSPAPPRPVLAARSGARALRGHGGRRPRRGGSGRLGGCAAARRDRPYLPTGAPRRRVAGSGRRRNGASAGGGHGSRRDRGPRGARRRHDPIG
jgi:hypothetical protein